MRALHIKKPVGLAADEGDVSPLGAVTSYEYEKARVHATSVSGGTKVVKSRDRRYQHVDQCRPSCPYDGPTHYQEPA